MILTKEAEISMEQRVEPLQIARIVVNVWNFIRSLFKTSKKGRKNMEKCLEPTWGS